MLMDRWERGASATQIADELGHGITRNAVIGKAHRLHLQSRRPVGETSKKSPTSKVRFQSRDRGRVVTVTPVDDECDPQLICTIMELTGTSCRWPYETSDGYRFCGRQALGDGGPYCAGHARRAYYDQGRRRAAPRYGQSFLPRRT